MTKKQETMYQNYLRATASTLNEIYGHFSHAKQLAFQHCMEKCRTLNGFAPRICTYNQQMFTFAFTYIQDGKKRLYYMTSRNDYDFEIEEMEV